jgi:hypothetical protein
MSIIETIDENYEPTEEGELISNKFLIENDIF